MVKEESREPRPSNSRISCSPPGCAALPEPVRTEQRGRRSVAPAGGGAGSGKGSARAPSGKEGAAAAPPTTASVGNTAEMGSPALFAKHGANFTRGFAGRWNASLWILRLVYSHMRFCRGMGTGPELWYLGAMHLDWGDPRHQDRLRDKFIGSCPAEKDWGFLWVKGRTGASSVYFQSRNPNTSWAGLEEGQLAGQGRRFAPFPLMTPPGGLCSAHSQHKKGSLLEWIQRRARKKLSGAGEPQL